MTVEELLLRLHDQLVLGATEDELESTRVGLDDEWRRMEETDRRLYAGLLHDLKSLRGRDVALDDLRHAADERVQLVKSRELVHRAGWEAALRA